MPVLDGILTQLSRSLIRPETYLAPALESERKVKRHPDGRVNSTSSARVVRELAR